MDGKTRCNELLEAARPLLAWIRDQHNPNIIVIVQIDKVQATEGTVFVPTEEFIED